MGHLDSLTISRRVLQPRPSRRSGDRTAHYRDKLIANLEEQIELAQKIIAGKPPTIKRRRGREVRTVRPRLWWHEDETGRIGTYIFHNRIALALKGGGRTIEVKSLRGLPAAYRKVIAATRAGELDAALRRAARNSESTWKK
jgi:hypothetical protein